MLGTTEVILIGFFREPTLLPGRSDGRTTRLFSTAFLAPAVADVDRKILSTDQALASSRVRHHSPPKGVHFACRRTTRFTNTDMLIGAE
jgi:hypothetical protein